MGWQEKDHLSPAERQALAFQAVLRTYLTAPDHCVEQRVMEQVELQRSLLEDLNIDEVAAR